MQTIIFSSICTFVCVLENSIYNTKVSIKTGLSGSSNQTETAQNQTSNAVSICKLPFLLISS
ncbi:hypothetical protein HanXRQr2_Chr05g0221201 [Helianthus annuus]|uniref:Uncharacterized protein n=1 Tax=Helianthus annuus TaxID=4232 RepID=A0A9K3J146_HELAN|nr:hypothetical protein HanXRQr2_Chr05g0221201 [Helianthus annuus]